MTISANAGDIDRRLLMDRSVSGRKAFTLPESDVPAQDLPSSSFLRDDVELPARSYSIFLGAEPAELLYRHEFLPSWVVHDEVQPEDQRRIIESAGTCGYSSVATR